MPVSIYSRYYGLETMETEGRISMVRRPVESTTPTGGEIRHTLVGGETLDQLALRYYGKEELWWRIADANPARFPLEWRAGDVILIPPLHRATRTPRR